MTEKKDGKRVVVGVDGSESSIVALRKAAEIADAIGARVDAVGCWTVPNVNSSAYVFSQIDFEAGSRTLLKDSVTKAFGEQVPENVTHRLMNRYPRQGLIEASKDADMLVLGRRGHGGFVGLLLGSVTMACVAHAQCPVLVVHDVETAEADEPNA